MQGIVHKLAVAPFAPTTVYSASGDGTVRIFDLRSRARCAEMPLLLSAALHPLARLLARTCRCIPAHSTVLSTHSTPSRPRRQGTCAVPCIDAKQGRALHSLAFDPSCPWRLGSAGQQGHAFAWDVRMTQGRDSPSGALAGEYSLTSR